MFALDPATPRQPSELPASSAAASALHEAAAARQSGWQGPLESAFSTAKRLLARYPSPPRSRGDAPVLNQPCFPDGDDTHRTDLDRTTDSRLNPSGARERPR
jgi:hypothetical protein